MEEVSIATQPLSAIVPEVPEEILKHDVFGDDGDMRLQLNLPETSGAWW